MNCVHGVQEVKFCITFKRFSSIIYVYCWILSTLDVFCQARMNSPENFKWSNSFLLEVAHWTAMIGFQSVCVNSEKAEYLSVILCQKYACCLLQNKRKKLCLPWENVIIQGEAAEAAAESLEAEEKAKKLTFLS